MTDKSATKQRKTRLQTRRYRQQAKHDIAYVLCCGILFFLALQGSESIVRSSFSLLATPVQQATADSQPIKPTPTPVQQAKNWQEFIHSAVKIAPIYNYPLKVLLSQAALESNRGLSDFAQTRNNYFGMNALDWNPTAAYSYENQEQAIIDYIVTIRRNFPEAWAARSTPEQMVKLLETNDDGIQYATDPAYISKLMDQPEWRQY